MSYALLVTHAWHTIIDSSIHFDMISHILIIISTFYYELVFFIMFCVHAGAPSSPYIILTLLILKLLNLLNIMLHETISWHGHIMHICWANH